jgi:predicted RND superfamily exporter protein
LFGKTGKWIAKHPWWVIFLTHVLVLFFATGFIFINFEKNTAKLYNPQNSQSERDLGRANKYFPLKFRREMVIVKPKNQHHDGVLTEQCFMDALRLDHAIRSLQDYKKYCMKDPVRKQCVVITPLELFQYNPASLRNVTAWLTSIYGNTSYLMSNGRPAFYNFPAIFGTSLKIEHGVIQSADVLQMIYVMNDPANNTDYQNILKFEQTLLDTVFKVKNELKYVEVLYTTARSMDDAVNESSISDLSLFFITFLFMIIFACLASGNFVNPRQGHALLATSCVIAVSYGIICGLGFGMWLGIPFISIVGFLPFLVLGVGLDDMFIIVNEFDRLPRGLSVVRCVSIVMTNTGSSITMTTVTTLAAYLISTSTSFLAIRYFCLYATFCIAFSYLFVVGFFVAALSLDGRRVKAGRLDCLPCLLVKQKNTADDVAASKDHLEKKGKHGFLFADRIMRIWAEFLLKRTTSVIVVVILVGMIVCGVIAGRNVDQRFDNELIAKPGSYLEEYLQAFKTHYSKSLEVNIILDREISYKWWRTQNQILKLSTIAKENKFYKRFALSWMEAFRIWSETNKVKANGKRFMKSLKTFLSLPQFRHFNQDIVFSNNRTKIVASRILVYTKSTTDTTVMCDAMLGIRTDLRTKSKLPAYAISQEFLSLETYSLTPSETMRNIFLSSLTIVVITSVYLVHPVAILLVFINFMCLVIELLGVLYFCAVPLNTLAMVGFVMAVGYSVDYSAHIAHAFILSPHKTTKERAVNALATVGSSVFWGGRSIVFVSN